MVVSEPSASETCSNCIVNEGAGTSPPQAASTRAALEIKAPLNTCENFVLNDIFNLIKKNHYLLILLQNYFKISSCLDALKMTLFPPQKEKPASNQIAGFLFLVSKHLKTDTQSLNLVHAFVTLFV